MEEKILKIIESKMTSENSRLSIENTCMFQISPKIGEEIAKHKSLCELSLTSCKLSNLKGLNVMENLTMLDVSENNLNDEMLKQYLDRCGSSLMKLFVAGNKISSFETFAKLSDGKLKQLDLMGNPLSESKEDYREDLFKMIASLKVIDGVNREGQEISVMDSEDEDEEGAEENEENEDMKCFIDQDEANEEEGEVSDETKENKEETPEQEEGAPKLQKRLDNKSGTDDTTAPEKPLKKVFTN